MRWKHILGAAAGGILGLAASSWAAEPLAATLNGSGSTFVKPLVEEAISGFHAQAPGVAINYAGGGSGKGRQDLADQVVDYAGSDSPIKAEDLGKYKGGAVLLFPVALAPITVSYNLPGVASLALSCPTVAKIFERKITTWNDPAIAAENAGVKLPATAITVAVRSDSSGTTDNFSTFLDKGCGKGGDGTWTLASGSTILWPAGVSAGNGNAGVAQIVKSTPGAIGYVDLSDAKASGLVFASIENKDGKYVAPTLAGASAAGAGVAVADNLTFSAVWAPGADSYPITCQTWLLVYENQTDKAKGQALVSFLRYVLGDGQKLASEVDYAPLPAALDAKAVAQIARIHLPQ
jgi:phosphate transport system substrate-binding protein